MAESIVKLLSSVFGLIASLVTDALLKKWVTWVIIAYERSISEASRKEISEAVADFKSKSLGKIGEWEKWRDDNKKP